MMEEGARKHNPMSERGVWIGGFLNVTSWFGVLAVQNVFSGSSKQTAESYFSSR